MAEKSFLDDIGDVLAGAEQVLQGARRVERAASGILESVDRTATHLAQPETLSRIVGAGLEAAAMRAGDEVAAGLHGSRAPVRVPEPPPGRGPATVYCASHGSTLWRGTIECTSCGRVFQVLDPKAPRFAPYVCVCAARLLPFAPPARGAFSGKPIGSCCFDERRARQGRTR